MFLLIIAALFAYFIKGLCGFANTLVFSTILSFGMNNINISPMELLLGYPSNIIIAWKERRSVNWKVCLPLAALVLAGNIPGIFLLKSADTQSVKIFFGIVIIGIGLEMLSREFSRGKKKLITDGTSSGKGAKIGLAVIGLISGLLCGLYGIGALLAAYIGRVTEDSRSFRGNLCIVFIVENTFRIILYFATGIITPETIKGALLLLPAMAVGLFAGMKSGRFLNEKLVKKLVIVMLIFSGAALIINNI